jgi:hypothetical protein
MSKETLDNQNFENSENQENIVEKPLNQILESLSGRSDLEESKSENIQEKVLESDPSFQKEIERSGILNKLGEKIKKNKLVRAGIVGLSLCSSNPVLASELNKVLNETETIETKPLSQKKDFDLDRISSLNQTRKQELSQILSSSSDRVRNIILDEIQNGGDLESRKNLGNDLLVLQQQVVDLQNSGEMDLRREGGVVLPFDENHSGAHTGLEYTDNSVAEDGGKQKITLENASEEQIRNWVNFLKNSEKEVSNLSQEKNSPKEVFEEN